MTGRTRSALLLLGVCLALRLPSLLRPCLSDDEATYCVVAREMLHGRVLYQDVVDHKPPLIYVTYAATQYLGGPRHGMLLLHLLTIGFVWATGLLLGRIALRASHWFEDERVPFVAALLFIVFTTTLLDFDALAANCELYMLLPLTASVLLYLRGFAQARTAELLGAGVLVGIAALYKYQAAVHLPLYACHLAVVHRRRAVTLLQAWAAIGLGIAVPVAASLWAVKRAGALDAALFWFSFNAAYIKQGFQLSELGPRVAGRVSYGVVPALFIWVLGLRAVAFGWRRRGEDPLGLFMVGWCAMSALAVTAGGRFFGHYFHQVTAPLAVLAAPEAARVWRSRRAFGLAALGLPAAGFLLIGLLRIPAAKAVGVGAPDYQAIAGFVRAHSAPTGRLVVWGNLPVLYFEADLPLGSRFVFSNYLTGLSPATRSQSDPGADASANVVAESWEMFVADLNSRLPEIFVDTSPGNLGAYGKFPLSRYPRLQAIVDRNYSPIGDVGGTRIFVRR